MYDSNLEPSDVGGCPADAVTLSVGQSCSLKCKDGFKATNEAFRSDNVQTLTCDSNKQYTAQPSCVRDVRAPLNHFHIFMFQLRHRNITHIAYSCHKEIIRKATFECKLNVDENSTRARTHRARTQVPPKSTNTTETTDARDRT